MADQNRCGNGSYTAWNRCDCLNDRLSFCVCNVSAEFSFFVYVDSDINNGLACTQLGIIHHTCTACCYDHDICLFDYRRHVFRSGMADGYGCVFL